MKKLLSPFEKEKKILHRVGDETITEIALKYKVSPERIIRLNNLDSPPRGGSILFVERGENRLYRVRPEDSIETISARTGVKKEDLLKENSAEDFFPYSIVEIPKKQKQTS